jgi:imidazolonepropionase
MQFDLLIHNGPLATMRDANGYGVIEDGAIGICRGIIAWIGSRGKLPSDFVSAEQIDLAGRWALPGLIDCHTHLVYAGNRANEFERRLEGESYADIARSGGGINATVTATRAASESDLIAQSLGRLLALKREGVTTVEIKSGYGLDTRNELKLLRAARSLGHENDVHVVTTLLAAHTVPQDFAGRADAYVDHVCSDTIPAAAAAGLADAVDAFCESIGFTPAQTRRVFAAARNHALPVKLHADQLSDLDGAALAAEFQALSADHLEWTNPQGVAALAAAGTVAVLLPGAYYALRDTQPPPVSLLRGQGVPIALATDSNPGTSPVTSITLILNMACTLFGLTPSEALAGITRNAARALGLADRGTLAQGLRADIAIFAVDTPAELAYRVGSTPCSQRIRGGMVSGRDWR